MANDILVEKADKDAIVKDWDANYHIPFILMMLGLLATMFLLSCFVACGLSSYVTVEPVNETYDYAIQSKLETDTQVNNDNTANIITPINTWFPEIMNINNYDDIISYFKNKYYEFVNGDDDTGWSNLLYTIQDNKFYYSIFDLDNNGVDEIILFNKDNTILCMFTIYNDAPFCLINSIGYYEIGYYTNYRLIGDNIIEEHKKSNIDYDIYSYYTMNNNHLDLIEKIFNGYVDDGNGKSVRKIIYTKDGIDRVMNFDGDEYNILEKKYGLMKADKRKIIECEIAKD